MKKIVSKIWITTVLASATACSDRFIELSPQGQQTSATFFQTEEHFQQAVNAAYVPLRGIFEFDFYLAEVRSDNTHYERSEVRGRAHVMREDIADFTEDTNNNMVFNVYQSCYKGISRTNIVIDRIAEVDIDPDAKNALLGQAKFLRAFYYFKLVRYFGDVPLYLNEVTTVEEAFLSRSPAKEVYDQIIGDAQEAIDLLAAPAAFPQSGRATKGAATMLLADVYMTLKEYSKAEALLKTLPAMGYQLLGNYADVFSTAHKNSSESIFEVQYKQGLQEGQESMFIYWFLPRSRSTVLLTGVDAPNQGQGGQNTPTQDLIDAYEPGDSRLDASIAVAEGTYNASGYLNVTANKSIVGYTQPTGKAVGVPYIKKYLNPHTDRFNTDDNWPVYRYAGALLLLAEALNEQPGKSAEALTHLNAVRDRAFGAGVATVTTTDPTALRKIIAHERRVELAFENHRWHDLVRTGQAIEVMTAYGKKQHEKYNYLPAHAYQVTSDRLRYPYPLREIEINPDL